jgi:zinc finger protein
MSEDSILKEPTKILEYKASCPVCGREGVVEDFIYEIPYFGRILLTKFQCPHCGYKHSDVESLEENDPVEITYRIEVPGDERALFVKSSSATIRVPEVGVEITPGAFSRGEITTVEGIVLELIDVLKFACESSSDSCASKIQYLQGVLEGKNRLTIIVEDPTGVSRILSSKAEVKKIRLKEGNQLVGE